MAADTTPPAYALAAQYGNRLAKPFALATQSQFRLGPPLALDSPRYAADLAEVRGYGAFDSTARSTRQTETATFWLGPSLTLYTEPLRVARSRPDQGIAGQAQLVALFHVALVDTQIATSDSKYASSGGVPSRRSDRQYRHRSRLDAAARHTRASGLPERPQHLLGCRRDRAVGARWAAYRPVRTSPGTTLRKWDVSGPHGRTRVTVGRGHSARAA